MKEFMEMVNFIVFTAFAIFVLSLILEGPEKTAYQIQRFTSAFTTTQTN